MRKWWVNLFIALYLAFFACASWAQDSSAASFIVNKAAGDSGWLEMPLTPDEEKRVLTIGARLRCMVCGGVSIIDSQDKNAAAMRKELEQQVREGKSDAEISAYMVRRYGEDVLNEPLLTMKTVLLWLSPALFALLAAAGWLHFSRRKERGNEGSTVQDEQWAREALSGQWVLRDSQWVQVVREAVCSK